jgi:MFS family permease
MRPFLVIWSDARKLPRPAWVLFGGTFINRFGAFVLTFLVLYLTRRGYSATQAGAALSLYGVGSIGAGLVGGQLADRMGRRASIALSMFTSAATMLALSQASTLRWILPLTGLAGFTAELYRPAAAALIADLTPTGERVTAYALYRLAVNAGVAAGPAVAGFIAERSFMLLFVGDAISSCLYGVIVLTMLPRDVAASGATAARGMVRGMAPAVLALGAGFQAALADRRFLRLVIASLLASLVFQQGYATLPLQMRMDGHPSSVYGLMMSLNGALIISLELWLTALTRRIAPRAAISLGIVLTAVGFGATGIAHSTAALAMTVVVWTFGEMCFSPVATAYVADIAPVELRGRYQGIFAMTFSIGLVIAPLVGTALLAIDPRLLWGACLVVGLLGAVLVVGEPRRAVAPVG